MMGCDYESPGAINSKSEQNYFKLGAVNPYKCIHTQLIPPVNDSNDPNPRLVSQGAPA